MAMFALFRSVVATGALRDSRPSVIAEGLLASREIGRYQPPTKITLVQDRVVHSSAAVKPAQSLIEVASKPCAGSKAFACMDCPGGWFCAPAPTPALPAPCGKGWPCYHCRTGWFCPDGGERSIPAANAPTNLPLTLSGDKLFVSYSVSQASTVNPLHPATGGLQYAGCYVDNALRALNGDSIDGGDEVATMTNAQCIGYCISRGFKLAGTENGNQCYCGNQLYDSMLLDESTCNSTCVGDGTSICGGSWALTVWSPDHTVQLATRPGEQFVLAHGEGGQHPGGVRQMVVAITTPVYMWPPPALTAASLSSSAAGTGVVTAPDSVNTDPFITLPSLLTGRDTTATSSDTSFNIGRIRSNAWVQGSSSSEVDSHAPTSASAVAVPGAPGPVIFTTTSITRSSTTRTSATQTKATPSSTIAVFPTTALSASSLSGASRPLHHPSWLLKHALALWG